MVICEGADVIAHQVTALLQNPASAAQMGAAAKLVADNNRGALNQVLEIIEHQLLRH